MTKLSDLTLDIPPVNRDEKFRTELTSSCRDSDSITKVENAGYVLREGDTTVQIMHNGLRVVQGGYHGSWMTEIIAKLRGHHEPQEELMFDHILKFVGSDATMIELGCFWSYYSLWFLKDHPNRRTLGVEPDPQNRLLGLQNAALNDLNLEILHGYVGPLAGQEPTFPTENSGDIYVPALSPATLIKEHFGGTLDILHCDTQGGEIFTVHDCAELLRNGNIRFLVVSTHSMHITGDALTHEKCLKMIEDLNAEILIEHDVQESFSGDGLIVAYFGNDGLDFPDIEISRNRYSTSLFRNPVFDLDYSLKQMHALNMEISHLNEKLSQFETINENPVLVGKDVPSATPFSTLWKKVIAKLAGR